MGKCRLYLGKITNSFEYPAILCKKIETIIIDGKTYNKSNCKNDSMKIQNFYRTIINNIDKITYIEWSTTGGVEIIHLKNKKIHNLSDAAHIYSKGRKDYYIEGKSFNYDDWFRNPKRIMELRKDKLERILDE